MLINIPFQYLDYKYLLCTLGNIVLQHNFTCIGHSNLVANGTLKLYEIYVTNKTG